MVLETLPRRSHCLRGSCTNPATACTRHYSRGMGETWRRSGNRGLQTGSLRRRGILVELNRRALYSFREGVLWLDLLLLDGPASPPSIPFLQIGQVLCSLNHAPAQVS